jgi:hypothetical protein
MTQKYNLRDVLEFYEQNEFNEVFSSEPNDKLKIDGKSLIVLNKKINVRIYSIKRYKIK